MKRREIKEFAQDEILNSMATTLISYQEQSRHNEGHSEEEAAMVEQEIRNQMDRVAKIFGYNQAWHQ